MKYLLLLFLVSCSSHRVREDIIIKPNIRDIFKSSLYKIEEGLISTNYIIDYYDLSKALNRTNLFKLLLIYVPSDIEYPFDHIIFKAVILKKIDIIKLLLKNDSTISLDLPGVVNIPLRWYVDRSTSEIQELFKNR